MAESLDRILAPLEAPTTADDAFLEQLFERVAPLAQAASMRDQTLLGRILRVLRRGFPQVVLTRRQRTAMLLVAALAMLALALSVAVLASRPDPLSLIRQSETVYRDPPAFTMDVAYSDGTKRRWAYDGHGRLRVDLLRGTYLDRPEGAWILTDINRNVRADVLDTTGTISTVELRPGLSPLHQLDLRWGSDFSEWTGRVNTICKDWAYVGRDAIAGRMTDQLQCSGSTHGPDGAFWVDEQTKLVLRSTVVAETLPDRYVTGEATAFQLDAAPDPARFAFDAGDPRWGATMGGGDALLSAGTRYVSNRFTPPFAITAPDKWWRSWGTDKDIVGFQRGGDLVPEGWGKAFVMRVDLVGDAGGQERHLGGTPRDVIDWIREDPYHVSQDPVDTTIGGFHGTSIDFREVLPKDFDSTCPVGTDPADPPDCRKWLKVGQGWWTYGWPSPPKFRVTAIDVRGVTITLLRFQYGSEATTQLDASDQLLQTIEFLDTPAS
jgi:hypothetical protein